MLKHTLEQWTQLATDNTIVAAPSGNIAVACEIVPVSGGRLGKRAAGVAEANAARIVQCVNACDGIPDPAAALDAARTALETAIRLMDLVLVPGRHDPIEANGYSLRQTLAMLSPPP